MTDEVLVRAEHICKYFKIGGGRMLHAVEDINLDIHRGETLGLVGESGCGKSTLGRTLMGIYQPTKGKLVYDGRPVDLSNKKDRFAFAKKAQIVFQDPYSSLNPRMSVSQLIAEPLLIYKTSKSSADLGKEVGRLMDTVGLARRFANSYPHELDGGRRQRIGIARALSLNPEFIVCDEPVSALDVSIQAQILNLMMELQKERNLTYLFITHNLSVVKHISDDITVMYLGQMVEKAGSAEIFAHQYHPYTKALISAIPLPKYNAPDNQIILKGEITSPINVTKSCRFAPRCVYAKPECFENEPQLEEIEKDHFVKCHFVREINGL